VDIYTTERLETMSGRGKKINQVKNERAHAEWMVGKKIGRRKQHWLWFLNQPVNENGNHPGYWEKGYWEKV
jgi:hypothetical protein